MEIKFSEFPLSYRLSQRGIAIALACSLLVRPLFGPNAAPLFWNPFAIILGTILFAALSISFYVIVRYPYISLIEPEGGDEFTSNYGTNRTIYRYVNCLAIVTILMILTGILLSGVRGVTFILTIGYAMPLLIFLIFLLVFYDPVRHPTIATFLRSTVGVGLLLLPLYLPAIAIGSLRCKKLLENATPPD